MRESEERKDQRVFVAEVGQDLRAGLIDKKHPFVKAREIILASWAKLEVTTLEVGGQEYAKVIKPETPKLTLDMDWLSESVKKIWGTYKAFVQFLGERYSVAKDGSVKDVMDRLSEKQQADLLKEIEGRLSKVS